jgi:DNA ligase-1
MNEAVQMKLVFDEIKNARGKQKESVIAKYSENESFLNVLDFAFNPFIVTGLAKKKMNKKLPPIAIPIHMDLNDLLEYIKKNNTGNDNTVQVVQTWISKQPDEAHEFLTKLVIKDVTVGVSAKTVNKVIPGLIPEYAVQHAKRWEDQKHKIKGEFAITLKYDGVRCTIFNLDEPKAYSRQGKDFGELTEIFEQVKFLPRGYVFDGELVADASEDMHSKDIFRLTTKITGTKGAKSGLNFMAFDVIPYDEYLKGKSSKKWIDRRTSLANMIDEEDMPNIKLAKVLEITADKEQVKEHFEQVIEAKAEGLVMCDTNAYYQTKRVDSILKLKPVKDADLIIVGVKEHKDGNRLGSIIVDYKGFNVNAGSGLSEEEGIEYWKKRDELIGKIAQVEYLNESTNEQGGLSLRHPVFVRLREDKTEPSYE